MDAHQDDYHNLIMEDSRNMIIKGKRTKRPRPSSPLALTMASTSSSTTTTTTTTTTNEGDIDDTENPNNTLIFHNNSIEFTRIVQENDVEEDMANCLILLAQGGQSSPPPEPPHKAAVEAASGGGVFYVYECKTCNRGFSSFQALGGHRASHKKPPKQPTLQDNNINNIHTSTTLSLHIGSNYNYNYNYNYKHSSSSTTTQYCNPYNKAISNNNNKVHECWICGAEFGSGQALGGHMRRHRSMPTTTSFSGGDQESKKPKTTLMTLSLDLNLPAPIDQDDDHRETKFPFQSKDQMIAFSNSSLVHCHH